METSEAGLRFVTVHEGLVLHPYEDSVGYCTIGVGHLLGERGCVDADYAAWAGFTEQDAYNLLRTDVDWAEQCVRDNVSVALNQNQFDALVSFVINLGCPQFTSSTALRRLNAGDYAGCVEAMRWWNNGGELDSRRNDEVMLFNTPAAPVPSGGGQVADVTKQWWAVTVPHIDPDTGKILSNNDFDMAKATIHIKRGVIITNPAYAQARRLPYVIYIGRADIPSEPWRFHKRVMQLTGAGPAETRAMLDDLVDRGLPRLPA